MRKKIIMREKMIPQKNVVGTEENGDIDIDPRQTPREKLDSEIHELVHALWPEEPENLVRLKARKISKAMWRLNYRRVVEI